MKKQWIYQIRGIAIIAVVVEHQMGVLHTSETIQLLTLFCVTTLIYLMGVTKSFSMEKAAASGELSNGIFRYSIRSMLPVICSYVVASFLYLCTNSGTGWVEGGVVPFSTVFISALDFGACPAFYFIRHYILLSLWAPFLYVVIKKVLPPPPERSSWQGITIADCACGSMVSRLLVHRQGGYIWPKLPACIFMRLVDWANEKYQNQKDIFYTRIYLARNRICFHKTFLLG